MQTAQERELIAGLRSGDEAAVQALADRYGSRIFQLAMRYMKNREDAEEVTQDVPDEGLSEGRRVPWGRGAFVVDLSDHFQHCDVAAAKHASCTCG